MTTIYVNPNLPLTVALAKFKKAVEMDGVLKQLRKREFHQTKSQKRKLKSIEARKNLKKLQKKRQS